jgi:hypothetical protein
VQKLTRVPIILHERLGNWARQLRARLHHLPVRWHETRSASDLEAVLSGVARPVVLIDLGPRPAAGLRELGLILRQSPGAHVLVLEADDHRDVRSVARELGATLVLAGLTPPPVVADLLARWVGLAQTQIEREGWSRPQDPDPATEPWGFLSQFLDDPYSASAGQRCEHPDGRQSAGAFSERAAHR